MSDEEKLRDDLFKLTMKNKWGEVVKKYENKIAHEIKLTKSEDTAFHIAISSYNSKKPSISHEECIHNMIALMERNASLSKVLELQNVRGETPLHLAAAVGWKQICHCIASKNKELITIRNKNGETPLFIAAHHGNKETFLSLHSIYNGDKEKPDESLCRRKDGNTVLHSAIAGEYFRLAHMIIDDYKNLITYVNVDGETPLHVLARKPNVFKSSSQLGFYESIVYKCVFVDDLKQSKHAPRSIQNCSTKEKFPENYRTCANFFSLFWDPIYKSYKASFSRSNERNSASNDEENQPHVQHNESFLAGCLRSKKRSGSTDENAENQRFLKIRKIQEKKVQHSHAMELMNKMIESEPSYKYDRNGQRPVQEQKLQDSGITIPDSPPNVEEHETHQSPEANIGTTSSTKDQQNDDNDTTKKDQNQSGDKKSNGVVKETPLLVAAKLGIPEMVEKIISAVPVAIQDEDSEGKNVLMLAVENRQTSVFDFLLQINLHDGVFRHVDNEGNSILHLAAKLGEKQLPWRIPGAAMQMQWEIKWYKHVKSSVPPLCFSHHNAKGETPRKIFTQTHENLVKSGNEWLIKTSESCSVVAALIATVAFATSATVPGGLNQEQGYPILKDHEAFDIFSIASLVALCLSITALVFFLAIITSRFEERDFKRNLPRKLLMGLTCLFSSIAAMLLSFCAGHTFILREKLRIAVIPIYAAATIPVTFFAMEQLPLYFDLLWAACIKVPLRSYKVYHQ
ncbi:hypothetical protein C2S52_014987 [Perilla frutescens var. hirtella]|nr:hypothetical protein C2S52_014987 [Perilla frutescens var. hirtella]